MSHHLYAWQVFSAALVGGAGVTVAVNAAIGTFHAETAGEYFALLFTAAGVFALTVWCLFMVLR